MVCLANRFPRSLKIGYLTFLKFNIKSNRNVSKSLNVRSTSIDICQLSVTLTYSNDAYGTEIYEFNRLGKTYRFQVELNSFSRQIDNSSPVHPEGTSIGSDNCDFLKVSDFNGSL